MTPTIKRLLLDRPLFTPYKLGGIPAVYDISDVSSLRNNAGAIPSSGDTIKLIGDKSGNSAVNCLCLNGVAGNYASRVDAAAVDITGDIDIRADIAMNDWSPAANACSVAKYLTAGNQRSYRLEHVTTGHLALRWSTDGSGNVPATSTAVVPASDFGRIWVRGTLDVDNGAGGYTATFYTSTNGSTWAQLGDPVVGVGTTSIFAGTAVVEIGSTSGGTNDFFSGSIYRAQIYNGIAGTLVFDANFATASKLAPSFTESSSNAATVTINSTGATGARIAGARDLFQGTAANQPVLLQHSGTNYGYAGGISGAYFSAPDTAVTGSRTFSYYGTLTSWATGATQYLATKLTGNDGFEFVITTTNILRLRIGNGASVTNYDSGAHGLAAGSTHLVEAVWVDVTGSCTFFIDGVQLGSPVVSAKTLTSGAVPLYFGYQLSGNTISGGVSGVYTFSAAAYSSGSTWTAPTTGETWTIVGSATIVTRSCLYFDGSNDYLKSPAFALAQPVTRLTVGSQVSWTSGDYLWDGASAANSGAIIQTTSTPQINMNAGSSVAANTGLILQTPSIVIEKINGASSSLAVDGATPTTGSAGAASPNGITIGASGASTAANFGNITFSERIEFSADLSIVFINAARLYLRRKWKTRYN